MGQGLDLGGGDSVNFLANFGYRVLVFVEEGLFAEKISVGFAVFELKSEFAFEKFLGAFEFGGGDALTH